MKQWNKFSGHEGGVVVFDGKAHFKRSDAFEVVNWRAFLGDKERFK